MPLASYQNNAYQTNDDLSILSASPVELVRMLYRGAVEAVAKARLHLAAGEIRERSNKISKACAIVEELTLSLNRQQGGEIAANLAELYVYIHKRLIQANLEQNDGPLQEVERLLATLLGAWEQLPEPSRTAPIPVLPPTEWKPLPADWKPLSYAG